MHAPEPLRLLENVLVGPLIAILSFVCSVGNVPLAAVLWSGGISFAGVIAFIFADLLVLPIVLIYRKYYGARFAHADRGADVRDDRAQRAGVDGLFAAAGLIPHVRPTRARGLQRRDGGLQAVREHRRRGRFRRTVRVDDARRRLGGAVRSAAVGDAR